MKKVSPGIHFLVHGYHKSKDQQGQARMKTDLFYLESSSRKIFK